MPYVFIFAPQKLSQTAAFRLVSEDAERMPPNTKLSSVLLPSGLVRFDFADMKAGLRFRELLNQARVPFEEFVGEANIPKAYKPLCDH